jgi:hypothetical protein
MAAKSNSQERTSPELSEVITRPGSGVMLTIA